MGCVPASHVTNAKKGIHPEWFEEAKVVCNGVEVLVTSGTQPKYSVEVWSGNHPFYRGISSTLVTDEGRVSRFRKRYAGLEALNKISGGETLVGGAARAAAADDDDGEGDAKIVPRKKPGKSMVKPKKKKK